MIIRGLSSADIWNYENGFYWFADTRRFGKFCAHYELYKRIVGLPGDVAEFGVYKAASLARFAAFRGLLEAEHSRRILGFDAYGAFPPAGLSLPEDRTFVERFESAGGPALSRAEVEGILAHRGHRNFELIEGDVAETLPAVLSKEPQTRFAMIHLDLDVYEATRFVLASVWDRIVPGGLLIVDDYNSVAGATRAIDEFIAANSLKLEKLPISHLPAFITQP